MAEYLDKNGLSELVSLLIQKLSDIKSDIDSIKTSLSNESWHDLSAGVSYTRRKDFAFVRCYADRAVVQGWNELGTLPNGFRPPLDLYFPAQIGAQEARGYIGASGRVAVYSFNSTGNASMFFIATFPI